MKRNIIALFLSTVLAVSSFGTIPVTAAEAEVQAEATEETEKEALSASEEKTEAGESGSGTTEEVTEQAAEEESVQGQTANESEDQEKTEEADAGLTDENAHEEEPSEEVEEETVPASSEKETPDSQNEAEKAVPGISATEDESEEKENGQIESESEDDNNLSVEKNATETPVTETKDPASEIVEFANVEGVAEDMQESACNSLARFDVNKLSTLPVLETDVASASEGCFMMGLVGNYIAEQQAFLDRINEIRKEACEEGVRNPQTGKPLTMDDYVPMKWSHSLEEYARLRAAESVVTIAHKRTNGYGTDYWESLSWSNYSDPMYGIEMWYAEKDDWINRTGNETGHYTVMISPSIRSVGGAIFFSPFTVSYFTTAANFSYSTEADESFVEFSGYCLQKLEVSQGNLVGDPTILGTFSGVKDDEQALCVAVNVEYTRDKYTANTQGILLDDGIAWTSSDDNIATVSKQGIVTAGKCGKATITATIPNGTDVTEDFTVNHVVEKTSAVEATCEKTGLTEGERCVNCGEVIKEQETVPAKGHQWKDTYTVDTEATCTEDGSESIHCAVCDAIKKDSVRTIPKKGHMYGDWTVIKEATCTEAGSRERTCSECGDKETDVITAKGHQWKDTYTVDTEATCTEDGSESIHCSVCGEIKEGSSRAVSKKEHVYGDWKVTKPATCTTDGSREKVCADCGDKVTESIPATGHKWNSSYTVDKKATATEKGSESIHCSVCGAVKEGSSREIPMLNGSWKKNRSGWWYGWSDGTYLKGCFEEIGGKTYYFNDSGYMVTGWQKIGGNWYYFDGSGAMKTGWLRVGSTWYYMGSDGVMQTGLQTIGNTKYFFAGSGAMKTGWQKIGRAWYFFTGSGAMKTGWLKSGSAWYYMGSDGAMQTGLQKIGNAQYFFNGSGAMKTGWQKIGSAWYYFSGSGAMVKSRWVGNYYLTEDGTMATNTWIGKYYVDADGKWIPGYKAA